jgi:hypothetical protein
MRVVHKSMANLVVGCGYSSGYHMQLCVEVDLQSGPFDVQIAENKIPVYFGVPFAGDKALMHTLEVLVT